MEKLPISWNEDECQENYLKFKITFLEAEEVILNPSTFKIRNIEKDYNFIGPVNDLSQILVVSCVLHSGKRKITRARKANRSEESAYFMNLAIGGLD